MSKIRTHYDNLKVSRNAPAEVIRAAYKVLTQKYHPDKNPGDAGAARIMHIINTSYEVLSDPQRRAAHDVWIADIEREAEEKKERRWRRNHPSHGSEGAAELEHKLAIEQKERKRLERLLALERQRSIDYYSSHPIPEAAASRASRRWLKVASLTLPFILIAALLALAYKAGKVDAGFRKISRGIPRLAASFSCPNLPDRSDVAPILSKANSYVRPKTGPNGLPWPRQAEYLAGSKVLRDAGTSVANIDNTRNGSDVLVKLVQIKDLRGSVQLPSESAALPAWQAPQDVRVLFIPAYGSFALKKIEPGSYEIHYQDLEQGVEWKSDVISIREEPPAVSTSEHRATQLNMLLYRGPSDACKAEQILKSSRAGTSTALRDGGAGPLSYLFNKVAPKQP
ncbi:J domain-containing protein [Methyloterricola oryzae]|uniref:J domain-containing protein n=1 Tax=Methyloterricola oryzae TaxID=1495050 RepID=UPI0005EB9104|nr:J domain-containing protein [Methyloterricola oryzae]